MENETPIRHASLRDALAVTPWVVSEPRNRGLKPPATGKSSRRDVSDNVHKRHDS